VKIELSDDDGRVAVQLIVKTKPEYRINPLKIAEAFEALCDDITVNLEDEQEQPS
jgi:hypothetical protein